MKLSAYKRGAKLYAVILAVASWAASNPQVLSAVQHYAQTHHVLVAVGVFCSYLGHLLATPTAR